MNNIPNHCLADAVYEALCLLGNNPHRTEVVVTLRTVIITYLGTFHSEGRKIELDRQCIEDIYRHGRICTGELNRLIENPIKPNKLKQGSNFREVVTAQRLKNYRRKYGPHIKVEDLPGVKEKRIEQ